MIYKINEQAMNDLTSQLQRTEIPKKTYLVTPESNHSIFRYDNFIGCFSADKIKKSVRK